MALRGRARVTPEPGRLVVEDAAAGEVDGLLVLRYHLLPKMRARPGVRLEPVRVGDDPVPLVGVREPPPRFVLELDPRP
jgi:hypothetical protein